MGQASALGIGLDVDQKSESFPLLAEYSNQNYGPKFVYTYDKVEPLAPADSVKSR